MQYLLPYLLLNMSFKDEERKQEDKHGAEPLSLEQRQNTGMRKMAVGFLVTWDGGSGVVDTLRDG
jgi:hypothetical protein